MSKSKLVENLRKEIEKLDKVIISYNKFDKECANVPCNYSGSPKYRECANVPCNYQG